MGKDYVVGSHPVRGWAWHPSPPDMRDKLYRVPRKLVVPPSVDLSSGAGAPFDAILDQGALGSCGPNSAAECIMWEGVAAQGIANFPMPSRLGIYYATRSLMGTVTADSGVNNRTMLKSLANDGWWNEDGADGWPYVINRFTAQPPAAFFDKAATRKITEYLSVTQDLNTMQSCLASGTTGKGNPFIFGFTVYSSWESPQVAKTGVVPIPRRGERVLGGHDITFVGYNASGADMPGVAPGHTWPADHFKFKNHYSKAWGDAGYGYMPFAYALSPQLASDFWCLKTSGISQGPPPPPPPLPGTAHTIIITGDNVTITVDGKHV